MDATAPSGQISIARRFAGPRDSANGGYAAGVLAGAFLAGRGTPTEGADGAGAVEVTLRRPPPLETALLLSDGTNNAGSNNAGPGHTSPGHTSPGHTSPGHTSQGTDQHTLTLTHDDQVVAHARLGALAADPVDAVSLAQAREAETSYAGLTDHPFVTCFACGTEREPGDGLRLSPGRIGDGRTACTWTPDPSLAADDEPTAVRPEFVWAALDCPGGWTTDVVGRPLVLGRITGEVYAPAEVGERHVVMGRLLGEDGRKTFTATTLYDSDGRVVARAEHVWIAVDPAMFR